MRLKLRAHEWTTLAVLILIGIGYTTARQTRCPVDPGDPDRGADPLVPPAVDL